MTRSILLSTPGRCGTHWLSWMLCELLGLKHQKTFRACQTDIAAIEALDLGGKLHLSHDPPSYFQTALGMVDAIAMLRDPRDIIVSVAYYWASDLHDGQFDLLREAWNLDLPDGADFRTALARLKETGHNVRWFREHLAHSGLCRAVVRYEDLWHYPTTALGSLIGELGYTPEQEQIEQALDHLSFRHRSGGRERGQEDTASFYRKGIIGDWRYHFTSEENRAFCGRFAWFMEALGYVSL